LEEFRLIAFTVTVAEEKTVARMGLARFFRMGNGAEALFGAGCDLLRIGDEPVDVAAVEAVHLFDQIEVAEFMAVEDDIVASPHLWDLVDRKADSMIDRGENVQYDGRDDDAVDDRRDEKGEERDLGEVGKKVFPEKLLTCQQLFFKDDFPLFYPVTKGVLSLVELRIDLLFEMPDLFDQRLYGLGNGHNGSFVMN